MPEGDTVWLTARRLHDALAGQLLTHSDFRVPRLATSDLSGRRVADVTARGKHILTHVDGGLTLHSHLGMEGSWRIGRPGARTGGGPAHQVRAVLTTATHIATGYRLPVLELLRTAEESTVLGHLGPDLLGPDWDPSEAVRRLLTDPGRTLADALTDQRNLAGIGNVYASELCFLARTSPWTPVGDLTDDLTRRTLHTAHTLLDANKHRFARRTTRTPAASPSAATRAGGDRDRALWVYGRAHRPCHRCGTPVRSGAYGPPGRSRVVYYCPRCQDGSGPDAPVGPNNPAPVRR